MSFLVYESAVSLVANDLQAEYEELAQRAEVLRDENASLRAELARIKKDYEQFLAQNTLLKVMRLIFLRYFINVQ